MSKQELKEQLQINLLQVFEDVNLVPPDAPLWDVDEKRVGTIAFQDAMRHLANHPNEFRDQVLDHMCDVIIKTVNEA